MKKNLFFPGLAMLFALMNGCGSQGQKQAENTGNEEVTSSEVIGQQATTVPSEASTEIAEAETNELLARFVKFSPSTSGSIFIFEDKTGEEHWFHKAPDAVGMDFVKDLQPMVEPEGYENIWFNLIYENREVERAGETKNEATIVKLERRQIHSSEAGKKRAFTADDLRNAVFSGTEPFWSLYFKDDHALRVSPEGEEILYYVKDGLAAQHSLEEVIVPVSPMVVEIQVTDEGMSVLADITIIRETCSDGMSDRDYPYTISLDIEGGESMSGCGRIDE